MAHCIDGLRRDGPVALVVDPVLRASSGAALADAAVLQAYRELLLPRASLITPNEAEARRLLGDAQAEVPALARGLRSLGAEAVCITGGDSGSSRALALDYLATPEASGWLALPRLPGRHNHGTGCSFASAAAAALARSFVSADALVLAKMLVWCAVRDGRAAGRGAGPVQASADFIFEPAAMPVLGWGDAIEPSELARWQAVFAAAPVEPMEHFGLYAISDRPARIAELAEAGIAHLQLRLKRGPAHDDAAIENAIRQSLQAVAGKAVTLWINDHWRAAAAAGASAIHLGQEDWLGLHEDEREALLASGLQLGLSSHSLWELARARGLAPRYIACGPVWPTLTKAMPWRPQGLGNLAWWVRMAGRPVLAIGGILGPGQARDCAATGAAGVCLVRALDGETDPLDFAEAWMQGRWQPQPSPMVPPQPVLRPDLAGIACASSSRAWQRSSCWLISARVTSMSSSCCSSCRRCCCRTSRKAFSCGAVSDSESYMSTSCLTSCSDRPRRLPRRVSFRRVRSR